ncbi:Msr family ABC-F type ribosomal protection protein [Alkalihalobacillus pseudalcaliphilus]|uniref:Msr family ABC-F type ribosomal protection protein n=1 Tax=Alkalihalobacillus pseudalcaliphilus TaxID=79884 RepID=UPI00064DAA66|nr:ABC-F type ribosomal protection protein [Alkalihalobacillus pseudalcaliphilus]KMK75278.1 antibiotic ABC transporter [Alkalihalobacillus pseudalcaliphilus]
METLQLELAHIEVSFLDQTILDIEKLSVYQFDRIGIVGKNGSGKSTLLKLLKGEILPTKGHVHRQIDFGYFEQTAPPTEHDADYKMLGLLNINGKSHGHLSGGEQSRLKLAQLFSNYHEGLLLDEPTTHLDQNGQQFLLDQLAYYYGALLIVSHDRYVLDQLVNKIWEVKDGKVTEYSGNYTDYLQQKQLEKEQQQEKHEKYIKEKERLIKSAEDKLKKAKKVTQGKKNAAKNQSPSRLSASKSKDNVQKAMQQTAKSLEHRAEQLEVVKAPEWERTISFPQSQSLQLHNKFPIMAERLTLYAGNKLLLKQASFQFPVGKTIALTGENGSGKSTLLHHILENGHDLTLSLKAQIGYYDQLSYQFEKSESVYDYLKERSDHEETVIRAALHSMCFGGSDLSKDICTLSGGERIRLLLCQLFLGRYNILILDEPTNFLDIDAILALEKFIQGYEGTIVLVSHDRTFVKRIADVQYTLQNKQLYLN